MNIQHHTHPDQLTKYSFLWSEARLVIAALALFMGGRPPIMVFLPGMYGLTAPLLNLSWIISGVAAVYLLYRWNTGGQQLFGGKKNLDTYAFFVSAISGLNLGVTGLTGTNIGMSIAYSQPIFAIVGILYLASAWQLWSRWKSHGERIF